MIHIEYQSETLIKNEIEKFSNFIGHWDVDYSWTWKLLRLSVFLRSGVLTPLECSFINCQNWAKTPWVSERLWRITLLQKLQSVILTLGVLFSGWDQLQQHVCRHPFRKMKRTKEKVMTRVPMCCQCLLENRWCPLPLRKWKCMLMRPQWWPQKWARIFLRLATH